MFRLGIKIYKAIDHKNYKCIKSFSRIFSNTFCAPYKILNFLGDSTYYENTTFTYMWISPSITYFKLYWIQSNNQIYRLTRNQIQKKFIHLTNRRNKYNSRGKKNQRQLTIVSKLTYTRDEEKEISSYLAKSIPMILWDVEFF